MLSVFKVDSDSHCAEGWESGHLLAGGEVRE